MKLSSIASVIVWLNISIGVVDAGLMDILRSFFGGDRRPGSSGGDNRPGNGGGDNRPDDDRRGPSSFYPPGISFLNDTCPVNTNNTTPCLIGGSKYQNATSGAWVCRTLYDIVTGVADKFSACVDTTHFLTTDACGCCNGVCPSTAPCTCACNITSRGDNDDEDEERDDDRMLRSWGGNSEGNGRPSWNRTSGNRTSWNRTGVLVQISDGNNRCVLADESVRLINGPGFAGQPVCVTTCPN